VLVQQLNPCSGKSLNVTPPAGRGPGRPGVQVGEDLAAPERVRSAVLLSIDLGLEDSRTT
jgi:hypothetical protein